MSIWTTEPGPYTAWDTERTGSVRRIIENSIRRVTEQGIIRIIERFDVQWSNEAPTIDIWTKE